MNDLYPFFRLAARPSIVAGWLWAVWLFCGVPALSTLDGSVSVLDATRIDQLTATQWRDVWRTTLLFPSSGAVMAALLSLTALGAPWSWTLPFIRARFVKGLAVLAAALSLPMSVLLARMNAGPAAVAAFAVGLFAFGASLFCVSRMLTRWTARLAISVMVIAIWKAGSVAALAVAHPWLVTIVALDGAALWFYLGHSGNSVRELVALASPHRWWQRKRARGSGGGRLWARPLSRGRTLDWVLASDYETWGSRFRYGWIQALGGMFVLLGVLAFLMSLGEDSNSATEFVTSVLGMQAVVIAPMMLFVAPPLLRTDRLCPLSRRRRAVVTWWATLATIVGFGVTAVAYLLFLVTVIPLLPWWTAGPMAFTDALGYLPYGLVWLPIPLWVHTRYAKRPRLMTTRRGVAPTASDGMAGWGAMLLFITATMVTWGLLETVAILGTGLPRIVAVLALAALVQFAYWLLLRRHFAKGDLV